MNKDSIWKFYLVLALLIPTTTTVLLAVLGYYVGDLIFLGMMLFCFIPVIGFSLYAWFTGRGYRWMNLGIDWAKEPEGIKERLASHVGKYMTLSMTIMLVSILLILGSFLWFILLFVVSMSVLIAAMATIGRVRKATPKSDSVGRDRDQRSMLVLSVAIMLLLTSMSVLIYDEVSESNDGQVTISVNEDSITITAPTVDETVAYADIVYIGHVQDFEKGSRVWGYGTPTVKSGTFHNSDFGRYTLASYAKVAPCIVISVNGDMMAFNQGSEESTTLLYDMIMEHSDQMSLV